jgi:hypothetical protein
MQHQGDLEARGGFAEAGRADEGGGLEEGA